MISLNWEKIVAHLKFRDIMALVVALEFYEQPYMYDSIKVEQKFETRFLMKYSQHFNYYNLTISQVLFNVRKIQYLRLKKKIKSLSLLNCILPKQIPIMHRYENMHTLNIVGCQLRSIANLYHMRNLVSLDLSNNFITEIKNLSTLKKLKVLNLSNNRIKIMQNMDKLKSLVVLNLSRNKIKAIKNLKGLVKLEYLVLAHNRLLSLVNIEETTSILKFINFSFNRIDCSQSAYKFIYNNKINTVAVHWSEDGIRIERFY